MSAASVVSSLVWVLLGLGVCLYALRLRLWDLAGPGSGFLPFIAGLVLGVAGLGLLVRAWTARPGGPFWPDAAGRTRVAAVALALAVLALLMPVLGFLLAAFLVMSFLLGLSDRRRPGSAVLLAAVSSLVIYGLFVSVLQVRLPRGLLGL
jgi:hypothetical protein